MIFPMNATPLRQRQTLSPYLPIPLLGLVVGCARPFPTTQEQSNENPRVVELRMQQAESFARSRYSLGALPPALVAQLPPRGTSPLGFRRLQIDSDYVTLGESDSRLMKSQQTYWNFDDNGVVSSHSIWLMGTTRVLSTSYSVDLGVLPLRFQAKNYLERGSAPRVREMRPATYPDVRRFSTPLEPAVAIEIPAVLPDPEEVERYRCTSASLYPARRLHANFDGDAINLSCDAMTANGNVKYSFIDAYLYAYQVTFRLSQLQDGVKQIGRVRRAVVER